MITPVQPVTLEDRILSNLIFLYRQKGIDLSKILGDQMFVELKTPQKIEALKKFAGPILAGTNQKWTSNDIKTILKTTSQGALGGAGAAFSTLYPMQLMGQLKHPEMRLAAKNLVGGALLVGTVLGGIAGVAKAKRDVNARRDLAGALNRVSTNPVKEDGAVQALYYAQHAAEKVQGSNKFIQEILGWQNTAMMPWSTNLQLKEQEIERREQEGQ